MCAQVGIGFGAGSFWPTQRGHTYLCYCNVNDHTHTHMYLRTPPQGWDCPTVSLYTVAFGIPSTADRIYWHSCLIACSVVHSVRATPPTCPTPPVSVRVSASPSFFRASVSLSSLTHGKWEWIKTAADTRAHKYKTSDYGAQTVFEGFIDLMTPFMKAVVWFVRAVWKLIRKWWLFQRRWQHILVSDL